MTWNYRVIRKKYDDGYGYHIHECYYHDGESTGGIPHSWSEGAIPAYGCSVAELSNDLTRMLRALSLPILEERDGELVEVGADG